MIFYREKKIDVGVYREVDIIPRSETEKSNRPGTRSKKQRVSQPKQQSLNEKNSKRYLLQLANGNFSENDLHVTCTYSNDFLPATVEAAEKEITNYLRRLSYRRKKRGLEPLKYILVTEYKKDEDDHFIKRVHHHIIMNGGLDRDEVEATWSKRKKLMGYVNADRIQTNENGLEALTRYLTKDPQGRKRWSSSRNLKRPVLRTNDYKYRTSKIEGLANNLSDAWPYFDAKYPNYEITKVQPVFYEETGWHIYLRMWKKEMPRGE